MFGEDVEPIGFLSIPPVFHSLLLDGPFTNCIECNCELLKCGDHYMIERIFRGAEPIMEMAICMKCRSQLADELSTESQQRIDAHVSERIVWEFRHDMRPENQRDQEPVVEHWLERCALTRKHRDEVSDYQIIGVFQYDQIWLGPTPVMFCGAAMEEIQKLLSRSTRDRLDEFSESHFGMPPEFCDNPHFIF